MGYNKLLKHSTFHISLQGVSMKILSVLLPAGLLAFLSALFLSLLVEGKKTESPKPRYTRRDRRLSWILTGLYALVAFWGLGDSVSPQSYGRLSPDADVSFTLPEGTTLTALHYFAEIDPGTWTLEGSDDGESWTPLAEADMNYVAMLKWNDLPLDEPASYGRYRLTTAYTLEIGEVGLLDAFGEVVTPSGVSAAANALFNEQDLVPEKQSYLNSSYFDEIYHARTAWESLRHDGMYEITHPPLGKLLIALGLKLFGVTPFGWRFSGTLCGVLMLPLLYAFVQRLFGRRSVSIACTLVFAFDFMHFTQTRIATIDSYSVFFILGMYYYMYRFLAEAEHRRLHLGLSGLFFGLGAASKWTCLYAGAGLALLWLLYWLRSGRMWKREFWENVGFCLLTFVLLPGLIYYLSYWPYGRTAGLRGIGMFFDRDYLRLVLDNQQYMFSYHSGLVATHPYASRWYQWIADIRPILYYADYTGGRHSIIMAFTSPLLCWGGLLAMIAVGIYSRRDRKAGFILLGYLSQLLPWVPVSRLTFAYHYFPSEIFLVLALGYVLAKLEARGQKNYSVAVAAIAVGLFVLFYPCLSGIPVRAAYCENVLKWFGSWPV